MCEWWYSEGSIFRCWPAAGVALFYTHKDPQFYSLLPFLKQASFRISSSSWNESRRSIIERVPCYKKIQTTYKTLLDNRGMATQLFTVLLVIDFKLLIKVLLITPLIALKYLYNIHVYKTQHLHKFVSKFVNIGLFTYTIRSYGRFVN